MSANRRKPVFGDSPDLPATLSAAATAALPAPDRGQDLPFDRWLNEALRSLLQQLEQAGLTDITDRNESAKH